MNTYVAAFIGTALFLGSIMISTAHADTPASDTTATPEYGLTADAGILVSPDASALSSSDTTNNIPDSSDGAVSSSENTDASSDATATPSALSADASVSATLSPAVTTDTQVKNVTLATSSVSMTYPVQAKLLGIIPATIPAQATVTTSGTTSINYPWYGFLYNTNHTELETKLQTIADAASSLNTQKLTHTQQVMLSTLIHAALAASLEAQVNTSTK